MKKVLFAAAVLTLAWPSLAWRAFGYELREHDLLVVQGVWFRHSVSIPLSRIQHVDTRQGPLERLAWRGHRPARRRAAGRSRRRGRLGPVHPDGNSSARTGARRAGPAAERATDERH